MSSLSWTGRSLLSHASDVNDLLEGLDGVLKDWFDRLHDTESSFHVINLWLHAFDGLHLSSNLNEGLSIIESLKDSSSKSLLDVLDSSGLSNGGIRVTSSLGSLGRVKGGGELSEELVFVHGLEVNSGGNSENSGEFHVEKFN